MTSYIAHLWKQDLPVCDIWSVLIRNVSYSGENQTAKKSEKVKVKLRSIFRVLVVGCSFERKVMLQLIIDNGVNMIGTETMMWSNAKKWLAAEKNIMWDSNFSWLLTSFIQRVTFRHSFINRMQFHSDHSVTDIKQHQIILSTQINQWLIIIFCYLGSN